MLNLEMLECFSRYGFLVVSFGGLAWDYFTHIRQMIGGVVSSGDHQTLGVIFFVAGTLAFVSITINILSFSKSCGSTLTMLKSINEDLESSSEILEGLEFSLESTTKKLRSLRHS